MLLRENLPRAFRATVDIRWNAATSAARNAAKMLSIALIFLGALALLACGWFASSWVHRRKIRDLRQRLAAMRARSADHASQTQRRIGQLQADLATPAPRRRPPMHPAPPSEPEALSIGGRQLLDEDGFAATEVCPDGFQPTRVMV